MSSFDYQIEKFTQALFDLATGPGDARSRVDVAYHRFWVIRLEEYPETARKDVQEITKLLTRLGGREGHVIPENLRRMTNRTASKIAELMVGIYFQLMRLRDERDSCRRT
jgi:hypothetical protein